MIGGRFEWVWEEGEKVDMRWGLKTAADGWRLPRSIAQSQPILIMRVGIKGHDYITL